MSRGLLFENWPEFRELVSRDGCPPPLANLLGELVHVEPGKDITRAFEQADNPVGLVVVDGIIFKTTRLRHRRVHELFSKGDVLPPPAHLAWQDDLDRASTDTYARTFVTLLVLADNWRRAVGHWPQLEDLVRKRFADQADRSSMHKAISAANNAADRILDLFRSDLADRFGRVTSDGIIIELNLTHEHIAGLVGITRRTASKALGELAAAGELVRTGADWKRPFPPGG
jgi:CRP-like cAMP-binding protein